MVLTNSFLIDRLVGTYHYLFILLLIDTEAMRHLCKNNAIINKTPKYKVSLRDISRSAIVAS